MSRTGRLIRVANGLLAVVVLLVPSARAMADEDPGPAQWPTIEEPDGGGNASDPGPMKWTTVGEPGDNGSDNDPKPNNWPTVEDL
jgi:hypothetical protein